VAHPASYTMGTRSFPAVKRPGRGVDHTPQSSTEIKESVEPYLYSPSGPSWPVIGWPLPSPHTCEISVSYVPVFEFRSSPTIETDVCLFDTFGRWMVVSKITWH